MATPTSPSDYSTSAEEIESLRSIGVDYLEFRVDADPENYKVCELLDLNLFVSSSDSLRDNLGGYFQAIDDGTLRWREFDFKQPANPHFELISSWNQENIVLPDLPGFREAGTIVPNHYMVCTVHGDPAKVPDDQYWKTLWTGGTIDGIDFLPAVNEGVFEDHYTAINVPYPKIDSQLLQNPETVMSYMDISYDYNYYMPSYQQYANTALSELILPMWYNLKNTAVQTPEITSSAGIDTSLHDVISIGGKIDQVWQYWPDGATPIEYAPVDGISPAIESTSQTYLQTMATASYSKDTQQYMLEKFQNFFFNENYYSNLNLYADEITGSMPYYVKINFPKPKAIASNVDGSRNFSMYLSILGFDNRFLRILKETFLEQNLAEIGPHSIEFNKSVRYISASADSETNEQVHESSKVRYRAVNMEELLLYSYNKITCTNEDFTILGDPTLHAAATYDTSGVYRHVNTAATIHMMDVVSILNNAQGIQNMSSLLNLQNQMLSMATEDPSEDYMGAPKARPTETLAYRVEKRALTPGTITQDTIQNFWFINSEAASEFTFYDSQVRYDQDYTYTVYAYNLIAGLKYRYSNLQLSRIIGTSREEDPVTGESTIAGYCIEYYDPTTDEAVDDIRTPGSYGPVPDISDLSTESQRSAVSIFGPDQPPYLANILVTVAPSMKIVEIPLHEKTFRILDHPPNKLSITPSFIKNATNQLQFLGAYQSFTEMKYPNSITAADVTMKGHYLHANSLIDTSLLEHSTVSKQEAIDIYRIDTRPKHYTDFDDAFLKSVNLDINTAEGNYTDIYFNDTIASNKKYYYLFRARNENNVPGYFEEVLEAELINDGGYKYAIFDTLFEEDFGEDSFVETAKPAKKLLQLSPAASHRALNSDNADFNNTAHEEYQNVTVGEAEDLIWNKTFKVRLTSKKTNKKIDLNVTYLQTTDIY